MHIRDIFQRDTTTISFTRRLKMEFGDAEIHVLRTRASLFGYNAPQAAAMRSAFRAERFWR